MKQLNWYLIYGKPDDVPDGKTVTPVNDVEIWQKCAGLTPTYTTLAGVLSDNSTLAILMSSDNAVDYMVRCTDWINEQTLIPAMTSATTPSGEVSGTFPETGTYAAYKAFDGDSSTYAYYENSSDYDGAYLVYTFPTAVNAKKAIITYGFHTDMTSTPHVNTNAIQAYVNNEWIDIASFPYATTYVSSPTTITVDINNFDRNATSYRLKLPPKYTSNYNLYIPDDIKEIQFYTAGIVNNENAMILIGANNYAANTLLSDSEWTTAICNSTYVESVLNVKTPVMTSATTPSGVVFASGDEINTKWRAFNYTNSGNTIGWVPGEQSQANDYLGYEFPDNTKIVMCRIRTYTTYSISRIGTIQKSSDNSTWTSLDATCSLGTGSNGTNQILSFVNSDSVKYYRVYFNGRLFVAHSYAAYVDSIIFYGRQNV